jgi:hypothetical protein
MSAIQASIAGVVSTLIGMLAGGVTATVYFAAVNFSAGDGPYVPPALAALVVVIPIALVLLPFQLASLAWCRPERTLGLRAGLAIGVISGIVAGIVLAYIVFTSSQQALGDVLNLLLIGVLQGCVTMFCLTHLTHHQGRGSHG